MSVEVDWGRLDAAGFRVSMKRSVRWLGWILAVVGAFLTVIGFMVPFAPFLTIGPVLAAAGIWNVCRPSIHGLLVDGVAMLATGAFHLLAGLWMPDVRASSLGKAALTGVFQIVWGFRRLVLYRTARQVVNDRRAIARLEAIVHELSKRSAASDAGVVEFSSGRFGLQRNRLGLYAEGVVALLEQQVVRLERRTDIWIEASGTTALGRSIKVRVKLGDFELAGTMPAGHFERFERWKTGLSDAGSVAA